MYDPALGRWMTIDPLAEKYNFQSPFSYAANNPIKFIDVYGLEPFNPQGDLWSYYYVRNKRANMLTDSKQDYINELKRFNQDDKIVTTGSVITATAIGGPFLISSIPVLSEGMQESLLLMEVSPEVLFSLAVKYPRVYAYLMAILGSLAPSAEILTPGAVMSKEDAGVFIFQTLMKLKGDTQKQKPEKPRVKKPKPKKPKPKKPKLKKPEPKKPDSKKPEPKKENLMF